MGRKLEDWLEGYIRYSDISEAPDLYHIWVGLFCLSAALERRVHLPWGDSRLYPNQYVILVGPSGVARKGDAIGLGQRLLEELNLPKIGEDNSAESLILDLQSSETHYFLGERMLTQCSSYCVSEELSVFTGYQNTRLLGYLTNWYDSRTSWKRSTKHQGIDEITNMCFNFLGGTAPDWIPYILTPEAMGGGFTSRVIFVVEQDKRKLIDNPFEAITDVELKKTLINDLEHVHMLVGTFSISKEAAEVYKAWYHKQDAVYKQGKMSFPSPTFDGYWARRPAHLMKMCMALSVSRGGSLEIIKFDIERALKLLEITEKRMSLVFSGVGKARYAEEIDKIIRYIEKRGTVNRSELLNNFYRNVEDLRPIIQQLWQRKVINVEKTPDGRDEKYTFVWKES